jgi:DNA-binding response OmpR family regulator
MELLSAIKNMFLNQKPRILVADDDEDLLMLMEIKMKSEGFVVEISPNGEKIFDIIEAHRPDIILLDITMRGVNGGEICKHLKTDNKTKDIPVIIFSANHNIEKIASECGADDCIVKPFNSITVRQKLLNILQRKRA